MVLTGVALGRQRAEQVAAVAAIGVIVLVGTGRAVLVDDDAGAAEVVADEVEEAVAIGMTHAAHGDGAGAIISDYDGSPGSIHVLTSGLKRGYKSLVIIAHTAA
jgi:hypothetical protein